MCWVSARDRGRGREGRVVIGEVSFRRNSVPDGVLGTTVPVLITRLLDLLCGVVSHVCVTEVPRVNAATLNTINLYFPVVIVVATFDGLFNDNNTPLFSVQQKRGGSQGTSRVVGASCAVIYNNTVILVIVKFLFTHPVLHLFNTSRSTLICTCPCLVVCLLNALPSVVSANVGSFVGTRKCTVANVASITVNTITGYVLSPIFVFIFSLKVQNTTVTAIVSRALSTTFILCFLGGQSRLGMQFLAEDRLSRYARATGGVVDLKATKFVVRLAGDLIDVYYGGMLSIAKNSVCVSIVAVVSDIQRLIRAPVCTVGRKDSPVLDCGCKTHHPGHMGRTVNAVTIVVFICATTV